MQSAGEWIEYQSDVVLVIIHAVVLIPQPGVQGNVGANLELVQNISVIGVLARLGHHSGRAVGVGVQDVVDEVGFADVTQALRRIGVKLVLLHTANLHSRLEGMTSPVVSQVVDEAIGSVDAPGVVAKRVAGEPGDGERVGRLAIAHVLVMVAVETEPCVIDDRRRKTVLDVNDGVGSVHRGDRVFGQSRRYVVVLVRVEACGYRGLSAQGVVYAEQTAVFG